MNQPEQNRPQGQPYKQQYEHKHDTMYGTLLQIALERELTAEELEQFDGLLAQNQSELAEFEAVDQLLAKLPDVTVSSNFTARVLDEAQRQDRTAPAVDQALGQAWWKRLFAPQYRSIQLASVAAVTLLIGVFGYQKHLDQDRAEMAESLQTVATITEMAPELLTDFDAIDAIDQSDPIDEELWAALK
tara:strand:+ start:248 stop:811 length:564 start_codon:yes stop_codon:yes gene_type:complete